MHHILIYYRFRIISNQRTKQRKIYYLNREQRKEDKKRVNVLKNDYIELIIKELNIVNKGIRRNSEKNKDEPVYPIGFVDTIYFVVIMINQYKEKVENKIWIHFKDE